MWRLTESRAKAVRPQMVAVLAVVLLGSMGALPVVQSFVVAPTQAAPIAVIQPQVPQVEGLTLSTPVDCSKIACMALTFDDGPSPIVTPQILDRSEERRVGKECRSRWT